MQFLFPFEKREWLYSVNSVHDIAERRKIIIEDSYKKKLV
jgi:hypothetical protein